MAETESQTPPPPPTSETTTQKSIPHNISFSIWPPSQRTREAVTDRLIETLTSESVLSKRYGTVPKEEAIDLAKKIEEEAFATSGTTIVNPEDDGIETLQIYSKEISKRMLEAVKSRSDHFTTRLPESQTETQTETSEDLKEKDEDEEENVAVAVADADVANEASEGSHKVEE